MTEKERTIVTDIEYEVLLEGASALKVHLRDQTTDKQELEELKKDMKTLLNPENPSDLKVFSDRWSSKVQAL